MSPNASRIVSYYSVGQKFNIEHVPQRCCDASGFMVATVNETYDAVTSMVLAITTQVPICHRITLLTPEEREREFICQVK